MCSLYPKLWILPQLQILIFHCFLGVGILLCDEAYFVDSWILVLFLNFVFGYPLLRQ